MISPFKDEKEKIDTDAGFISLVFISEIEKHMDRIGISKADLARELKTSKSYLTQLWRGDKYLNMAMIAKIQFVLRVKFEIKLVDQ